MTVKGFVDKLAVMNVFSHHSRTVNGRGEMEDEKNGGFHWNYL